MAVNGVKFFSAYGHGVFRFKTVSRSTVMNYVPQVSRLHTHGFTENISDARRTDDHYLKKKFDDLVLWYERLTGMDEVRLAQNRVCLLYTSRCV